MKKLILVKQLSNITNVLKSHIWKFGMMVILDAILPIYILKFKKKYRIKVYIL